MKPVRRFPKLALALSAVLALLEPACAAPGAPTFHSLLAEQPVVLEVSPPDRTALPEPMELSLRFSERIDLESVGPQSIALLQGIPKAEVLADLGDLEKKLRAGELPSLAVQYLLDEDERGLTLLPETDPEPGIYFLVVTPALLSARGVPFNQEPGKMPAPFTARFTFGEVPNAGLDAEPGLGGDAGGAVFGPAPETLVIHEFLYDGKVSDTDGESFVELYGTANADIGLYQILFFNGENGAELERITLPPGSQLGADGIFLIADLRTGSTTESKVPGADFRDQFDPQNGPDGLQLLDRDGRLLDTVAYGVGVTAVAANGLPLGEGAPTVDVAAGHSLSRSAGADSQDNATDFLDLATPSPGLW